MTLFFWSRIIMSTNYNPLLMIIITIITCKFQFISFFFSLQNSGMHLKSLMWTTVKPSQLMSCCSSWRTWEWWPQRRRWKKCSQRSMRMVCILNFLQGLITFENVTSAECSMKGGVGGGCGGRGRKGRPYLKRIACHVGAKNGDGRGRQQLKRKGSPFSLHF